MISDKFNMFFENVAVAASAEGTPIEIAPLTGRNQPVHITTVVKGGDGPNNIDITIQESADGSTWTDLSTFRLKKLNAEAVSVTVDIPKTAKETKLRLNYVASGTLTDMYIWSGVTRDDPEFYANGQYIDDGKVVA